MRKYIIGAVVGIALLFFGMNVFARLPVQMPVFWWIIPFPLVDNFLH